MDHDDLPVGRILSRREALTLLGAVGATILLGRSFGHEAPGATTEAPSCVVRPQQFEGPFFTDARLERSDVRLEPTTGERREGTPFMLTLRVFQIADRCTPLEGATVDIWHCDAAGEYSAFEDTRQGFDHVGQIWLRGYQVTDENGEASFTTIYPGWYPGRAVHIHVKIRATLTNGKSYEFTSQLYFLDELSDVVFQKAPYLRDGERGTRNANDFIFAMGGEQLVLDVGGTAEGYAATFDIGLDVS